MIKKYEIEVDCANCANKIEERLNEIKGIKHAQMNFLMQNVKIEYEDGVKEATLKDEIKAAFKYVEEDSSIEF